MEFDEETKKAVKKRMEELDKDPAFKEKLEKEVARLKGRNLRHYISSATKRSEKEVR